MTYGAKTFLFLPYSLLCNTCIWCNFDKSFFSLVILTFFLCFHQNYKHLSAVAVKTQICDFNHATIHLSLNFSSKIRVVLSQVNLFSMGQCPISWVPRRVIKSQEWILKKFKWNFYVSFPFGSLLMYLCFNWESMESIEEKKFGIASDNSWNISFHLSLPVCLWKLFIFNHNTHSPFSLVLVISMKF